MLRLIRYLKPYKKQVFLGPLFKIIEAIFELLMPFFMARIIDIGVQQRDASYVWRMGGLLLLASILCLGSTLVCQRYAAQASQGVGTNIRKDLYHRIQKLSFAQSQSFGVASLTTRLLHDTNQIQLAVAMLIRLVIRAPFLTIGAVCMAFLIDVKSALIFLLLVPLLTLILWFISAKSVPYFRTMQQKLDRAAQQLRENLSGERVIRACSTQKTEQQRFENASADIMQSALQAGRLSALFHPLTTGVLNLATIAVIWFGGVQVQVGSLTQGEVIALIHYLTQISVALAVVINLVHIFTKAAASATRINEILETPVPEEIKKAMPVPDPSAPLLEFRHVSFAYHQEYCLNDISFALYPGETIGIIGGTGSGKSTLLQLIPKLFQPNEGEILLFGHPLSAYPLETLRQKIAIVPQKSALLSGTVRFNLELGRSLSDKQIQAALQTAQALSFVQDLSNGEQTVLQQGGSNLSGGQRQRLCIARALAGNSDLLLLDDATSALDYATERALLQALQEEKRSVLLVSQRISSLHNADRILVLDQGHLVGCGTQKELWDSCPLYREIAQSQGREEGA